LPVERLKDSEKKHLETLSVMENIVKPQLNEFQRMEIELDSDL
jgi:hypothetical protein